jgi:hypothetical protein
MSFLTNDKLTIVGAAGMIGSNMAQTAAMMRLTPNICLYDPFEKGLEGVVEEMRHCGFDDINFTYSSDVKEAFTGSKYMISSGGAPRKDGMTREDLLKGNAVSAISAFLLPVIARQIGRKATHSIALAFGGVSLISLFFIKDPNMLVIPMIGVGFAWGSILSMPYAILTGSLPANKMGTYMGIFNFFIVIPQILAASILGFITRELFNGQVILTLVLAGCSLILGALSLSIVQDKDDVYKLKR